MRHTRLAVAVVTWFILAATGIAAQTSPTPDRHRAAIEGRVFAHTGGMAANARVWVRPFPSAGARPGSVAFPIETRTSDSGEFRIANLDPGPYLVVAVTESEEAAWRTPRVADGGFVAYPDASTLDGAAPLVLREGQTVTDLALRLHPRRATRVSGVVLTPEGKPADDVMLTVSQMLAIDQGPRSGVGQQLRQGAFDISLLPGFYELRATTREVEMIAAPGGSGVSRRPLASATMRMSVDGDRVENMVFRLAPPRVVTGRIVLESGGLAKVPSSIRLFATYSGGVCEMSEPSVKDDRTFTMRLSGDRCLVGAVANDWQMRSVISSGRDVTADGLVLEPSTALGDVVITLTDRTTRVVVDIADATGARVDASVLFAFPVDRVRRVAASAGGPELQHRLSRRVRPLPSGDLRLNGLLPGEYYLVAVAAADAGHLFEPEWLERLEPFAQRLTIGDGEVQRVRLRVAQVLHHP